MASPFEHLPPASDPGLFVNRTNRTVRRGCGCSCLRKHRLAAQFIFLVPLRLLFLILLLCVAWFLSKVGTCGLSRRAQLEYAVAPWRRAIMYPTVWIMRLVVLAFGYNWIPVHGTIAPRDRAPIVICNHMSFVETVILAWASGGVSPISAAENAGYPLIGAILDAWQTLYIVRDRSIKDGAAASKTAGSAAAPPSDVKHLIEKRAHEHGTLRLMIFPEGTTTNGEALMSFKLGAFNPGVPVQPAVVWFPEGSCDFVDPSWVADGPTVGSLILSLMSQLHNRAELRFLDVCVPSEEEKRDPALFAKRVKAVRCTVRAVVAATDICALKLCYACGGGVLALLRGVATVSNHELRAVSASARFSPHYAPLHLSHIAGWLSFCRRWRQR